MKKAFMSVSCVLDKLKFKELGWQQFPGSVREFQELSGKILKDNGFVKERYKGQKGYLRFAKDHYGADMQKVFRCVSSVLDKSQFKELAWQQFPGSAREFQELFGKILNSLAF